MTSLQCEFNIDTFNYNIESNLQSMGIATPADVYGTAVTVVSTLRLVDEALKLNPKAPLPTPTTRYMIAGGAILAAGWAGAVLGSAIMATNRATRCEKKEMEDWAKALGLSGGWIDEAYNQLNW